MSHNLCNYDCPICGITEKEIQFYGFSYCNHPICGVCAIKLQKFSKDTENDYDYSKCVICKQDISKIILTPTVKPFEDVIKEGMLSDIKYNLLFESEAAKKFYQSIIKISCPVCKKTHETMEDLMHHMEIHKKRYCELCISFNKCLQYELEVMTDNDYHQHRNKKHPKCKFCDTRFYDDGHLLKHVKDKHFLCDICHRNRGYVAYSTQPELLKHYLKDHHVCEICRAANNINVFESEYNLKTHKVAAHALSLVGEGLVNVGYGDRDNQRYGARRRARDVDDAHPFDEATPVAAQALPTMHCEQEFPRLGATDGQGSQPQLLGTPSMNTDENDARTAFTNGAYKTPQYTDMVAGSGPVQHTHQPLQHTTSRPVDKMASHFAISIKKSSGRLNDADFPSLATGELAPSGRTGGTRPVEFSRIKSNYGPACPVSTGDRGAAVASVEDDFPSLSVTSAASRRQTQPCQSAWSSLSSRPAVNKPVSVARVSHPHVDRMQETRSTPPTASGQSRHEHDWPATPEDQWEAPPENQSKVSLIPRQQFEMTNGATGGGARPIVEQSLPGEHDFPSLRGPVATVSSSSGASWGRQGGSHGGTAAAHIDNKHEYDHKFTIDSKQDFPGLPMKPVRTVASGGVTGWAGGVGRSGASVVAAVQPSRKANKKNGKKSDTTQSQPQSQQTLRQAPYVHVSPVTHTDASWTEPASSARQPSSLRGFDYIPSVAPVKDPLVVMDSDQFSKMRSACNDAGHVDKAVSVVGHNYQNEEGVTQQEGHTQVDKTHGNRYGHLDDTAGDVDVMHQSRHQHVKHNKPDTKVPLISSEHDFPSLGGARPVTRTTGTSNTPAKQCKPPVATQRTEASPVVSLMDVAMSVAHKAYTAYPDADDRNQAMFSLVYGTLEAELATQFLQLSNLYRTRKLAVHDYVAALLDSDGQFGTSQPAIAAMLPEMCVLLPDIPLQCSLMDAMPKLWVRDLRQCQRCAQVVHGADMTLHGQLAHHS